RWAATRAWRYLCLGLWSSRKNIRCGVKFPSAVDKPRIAPQTWREQKGSGVMDGAQTPEELEGRLIAQRLVLQWLLKRAVTDRETLADLLQYADATQPIQDHQEDPGAVPARAFATEGAATAELRLILAPIEGGFENGAD